MPIFTKIASIRDSLLSLVHARIMTPSVESRLARGVFWSITGTMISRGLMVAASVLIARLLGKTGYGELGMIRSTIEMSGVLAGFGLGVTATKFVSQFFRQDPDRAGRIIALSFISSILTGIAMTIVLLAIAPWLAIFMLNAPHLANVLRIGSPMILLSAVNGAQIGTLAGFEAFHTIARINVITGIVSFPILAFGAWADGLSGVILGQIIVLAINWWLNFCALGELYGRHGVKLSWRGSRGDLDFLWQFSLPAVLSSVMIGPVNWYCGVLVVNQPGGYGEMGVYSVGNQWFNVLMFLPVILGSVVLPILSEQMSGDGQEDSVGWSTMVMSMKINAAFVLPLVLIFSLASPYIMMMYGEGFAGHWPTLIVILITSGLLAIQTPVGQVITASGRMWLGFVMNLGWALIFITGTMLMLDQAAFGLASARLLAYVVHGTWTFGFAWKLIKKGKLHAH